MRAARVGAGGELGRRLLGLIVVATWLPLVLLSWISLRVYESRLKLEATDRLTGRAKSAGFAIFERLESLRSDLAAAVAGVAPSDRFVDLLTTRPSWNDRFESLVLTAAEDASGPPGSPELGPGARARLRDGLAALAVDEVGLMGPSLWLVSPRSGSRSELVWGRARLDWVWPELAVEAGDGEGWLLFASDRRRPIATSPDLPAGLLAHVEALADPAGSEFEWRDASSRTFSARFWTVPLGFEFGHPGLTVLVSEPYRVGESVAEIRRSLFLLALGSLLLMALVGIRRLRSDLGPLEKLAEGARLMAAGNFSARVEVGNRDEVGRLAGAFNQMANELERRFHEVEGTRNIAASALAAIPSRDEVARVFVDHAVPLASGVEVVVALADGSGGIRKTFSTSRQAQSEVEDLSRFVLPTDLRTSDRWVTGGDGSAWRSLKRGGETLAMVGLLGAKSGERDARAALLNGACDQLALAFAHVRLIEELDQANWGALTALARAVDAKSAWTHGHSVRVAEIATAIATETGHTELSIRRIRRGCLVHDLGKIGVPNAVLDKRTALDDAEISILRSHVEKGARILEPIAGLAEVLPIVWQHHERIDGSGYPKGLRGGEIDPEAALVAVADVFEALTAARPYRAAWDFDRVERYLGSQAGVQFDAVAVDALIETSARYGYWSDDLEPTLIL